MIASDTTSTEVTGERIHYVIAVHGIGKQRKNETILPVINQFAAVRHNETHPECVLSLGALTSQSNAYGWIEFANIPKKFNVQLNNNAPWVPSVVDPASESSGDNFRFVDFCWSEVMHSQHDLVGESTEAWTDALINRLKLRSKIKDPDTVYQGDNLGFLQKLNLKEKEKEPDTAWIVYLMEAMQKVILPVEFIMNLRIPTLSHEIFGEFLGDVELYGNFPHTRGEAVRLFHETMAALHQAHRNEFGDDIDPHYTIIAHSLGTVMTLDAITYAFANKASRKSDAISQDQHVVHFPGYKTSGRVSAAAGAVLPELNWVQFLESYVTLGSPIDKYLVLWTENYKHFSNTEWMDRNRINHKESKIRHFNYADEQDPVGHELDILETTPVWNELFEIGEDVVFARYAVPGVAHVNYWQDTELFHRILDLAVDRLPKGYAIKWFTLSTYFLGQSIAYIALPVIGWLGVVSYLLALSQITWSSVSLITVFWVLGSLFVFYKARKFMKIIIAWRILMVHGRSQKSPMEAIPERQFARRCFRNGVIHGSPILWGILSAASFFSLISLPEFVKIALYMAFAISLDILYTYKTTTQYWKDHKPNVDTKKPDFSTFLMPNTDTLDR